MHYELTIADLEAETAVALPERQLMNVFGFDWANVSQSATTLAVNAGSLLAQATALSGQTVVIGQA